jgi:hypothetical protein
MLDQGSGYAVEEGDDRRHDMLPLGAATASVRRSVLRLAGRIAESKRLY